jgi:F-type H+-transporting ATPase subunit b
LIDALPGNSLVSKAAILSAGAGVSIAAISNEIYVVNEETIVAFCLLTVMWGGFHYLGPSYVSWADSQRKKMGDLLNVARENHTESVKERISTVNELSGVVDITKNLFEVSKVRNEPVCASSVMMFTIIVRKRRSWKQKRSNWSKGLP